MSGPTTTPCSTSRYKITLISPRLAVQKGDFLGSGVPYWPVELAVLASFLRQEGHPVSVIDLFGSAPGRLSDQGDHYLQGAPFDRFLSGPAVREANVFILYALSYMSHRELLGLAKSLKTNRPNSKIAILENSQAVTAYSLPQVGGDFFAAGVDALLCGEACFNWPEILAHLVDPSGTPRPGNILTPGEDSPPPCRRYNKKSFSYPIPAWDLFNLKGYWALPYSHGPKTGRFLPILTSRGCPFPCDFCVVPETNDRLWRGRPAAEVVQEIITLRDRFGVKHFQVEDLNPTVNSHRWDEICRLLIERRAGIFFYFVSGTKAETVRLDQIPLLAAAGCRYISISPESGSPDLMKVIGKRFDYEHGLALVKECRRYGIKTQACLLVGHPAETEQDHDKSKDYLRSLVRAGLDEVAVFIIAPFAGSGLFVRQGIDLQDQGALVSFSPRGRKGFEIFQRRRRELVRLFFLEKLRQGPDLWRQGLRAVFGHPRTKMENLPRRVLFIFLMILWSKVRSLAGAREG